MSMPIINKAFLARRKKDRIFIANYKGQKIEVICNLFGYHLFLNGNKIGETSASQPYIVQDGEDNINDDIKEIVYYWMSDQWKAKADEIKRERLILELAGLEKTND